MDLIEFSLQKAKNHRKTSSRFTEQAVIEILSPNKFVVDVTKHVLHNFENHARQIIMSRMFLRAMCVCCVLNRLILLMCGWLCTRVHMRVCQYQCRIIIEKCESVSINSLSSTVNVVKKYWHLFPMHMLPALKIRVFPLCSPEKKLTNFFIVASHCRCNNFLFHILPSNGICLHLWIYPARSAFECAIGSKQYARTCNAISLKCNQIVAAFK